jgi:hypothetical protein
MSRAERRAYKRMMKNQDPYAVPAGGARGRAQRVRARRAMSGPRPDGETPFLSRRFLLWWLGGAAAVALVAFSLAWPNGMPMSLYIGLAGAAGWSVLLLGFRLLQRRAGGGR